MLPCKRAFALIAVHIDRLPRACYLSLSYFTVTISTTAPERWTSVQSSASWYFAEIGYTHQAEMGELTPGAHYVYRVGCGGEYAANYTFRAQAIDAAP